MGLVLEKRDAEGKAIWSTPCAGGYFSFDYHDAATIQQARTICLETMEPGSERRSWFFRITFKK